MMQTETAYSNPPAPKSETSNPLTTLGQVCADLEELCAVGLLEAYRDEYNVVRYRPIEGRAA
jgi:hypothetical protein